MNSQPATPEQDLARLEQAGEWHARLQDGGHDAALRTAFENWLGRDLRNRLAYADVCAAGYALEQAEIEVPATRHAPARAARPFRPLWLGLAASLFVLVLAWQGTRPLDALRSDLRTAEGETQQFELPDGSTAWLAGDSAVALDFGDGRRDLVLLRGEAMFDVVKDPSRPFVVTAGDTSATAVGTRYGVAHRAEAVVVEVEEGRVSVETGAAPVLVDAGQQIRRDTRGLAAQPSPLPGGSPDWRRGLLVFEDATLAEAAARLDAWIPGRVIIVGAPSVRVSAAIATADAPAALAAIAAREGLAVESIPGVVTVVH